MELIKEFETLMNRREKKMDENEKRFMDEMARSLMGMLSSIFGQQNNQIPTDIFVEVQEGKKETTVLLQISGIEDDNLNFEILKKSDIDHLEMEGDYKILHLKTRRYGELVESGIMVPTKIKKVKSVSVRNGVIEVILV